MRRVVVGASGGVTSAWCLDWALNKFPKEEVVALFHDTKSEDPDTYRFLHEITDFLGIEITERSDGRSVDEVEEDEGAIANNQMAFCSRILKVDQRNKYFDELRSQGVDEIILVLGYTSDEWRRIQRAYMTANRLGYLALFPLVHDGKSKEDCFSWLCSTGIKPPSMYDWSGHANCVGCRRGGKNYWKAVLANNPNVYYSVAEKEAEFGHTVINGITLYQLEVTDIKVHKVSIEVGTCECGT